MNRKRLGRSGIVVTDICMGTMTFGLQADEKTSFAIMDRAVDAGIDFFDTAEMYPVPPSAEKFGITEEIVGRWLKGRNRERLIMATKVTGPGHGWFRPPVRDGFTYLDRRAIHRACEDSLRRLQTDYIDLYQTHWPDHGMRQEDTLGALTELVEQGKVRAIGCSNETSWGLMKNLWEAEKHGLHRFDTVQNNFSLINRRCENELAQVCRQEGVSLLPYSPLGGGVLTGKYNDGALPEGARFSAYMKTGNERQKRMARRFLNERTVETTKRLQAIARDLGISVTTLSVAWSKQHDFVASTIIGAVTLAQLEESLKAADMTLDAETLRRIDEIDEAIPNPMTEALSRKKNTSENHRLMKPFLAALILAAFATIARSEAPFFETADLFTSGEGGFKLQHIPGIVVTAKGTVLAWCEARKGHKVSDWDDIRILIRRSADGGRTFDAPRSIAAVENPKPKNPFSFAMKGVVPEDTTYNNPVLIAGHDGTVHMLFCVEYMRCFYQRSTDDGMTFSKPVEITAAFETFRKSYDWKVLATGPDHSIQLKSGRLIVPVWLSTGTGGNAHRPSVTATIYSDDSGKTWHAGEIAVPCTDEFINPNETVAIELADGSVMLNVRSESKAHRRIIVTSKDGATGWSTPKFDEALFEPICMASIVRYSLATNGGRNRILFSNPHNLEREGGKAEPGKNRDRKNVSMKLSYDEGRTWPVNKSVDPGYSGYSDIAVTKDGTILCFYGRGEKKDFGGFAFNSLTLARFNLAWLTDGKDEGKP